MTEEQRHKDRQKDRQNERQTDKTGRQGSGPFMREKTLWSILKAFTTAQYYHYDWKYITIYQHFFVLPTKQAT